MLIIFLRTLILYFILLLVMRLMGKRQIGEMQPFEFIITLLIAELVCIPMTDVSIPLTYGIVSVLAVFIVHQLISVLERSGDAIKFLVSGKPSVVITPNGVNILELKRNNLGVDDLIEAMRGAGYFSLDDLQYAIFESNGKLSALEKPDYSDKKPSMPLLMINEGKINAHNFELTKMTPSELLNKLGGKANKVKDIAILTLDENGKVFLQKKKNVYETINIQLPEGTKW